MVATTRAAPAADQRVTMYVPWSGYETLLAVRGEAPRPRMHYLEGTLELMSPSREHEMTKSQLGRLVEAYAADQDIDLWPIGSWTIKNPRVKRGAEPDECYTLGDPRARSAPDLAIEVVWTSGGIDKLEIYRRLDVREVWFWEDGAIAVYILDGERYQPGERSALLPDLDLEAVAAAATMSPRDALAALRASY